MRAGVNHWSHGAIIFALELAIFLLPFSGTLYSTCAFVPMATSLSLLRCTCALHNHACVGWTFKRLESAQQLVVRRLRYAFLHLLVEPSPSATCAALCLPAVVQYLPNFFFGALLTVFGIEIAGDWLVRSYEKVRPSSICNSAQA